MLRKSLARVILTLLLAAASAVAQQSVFSADEYHSFVERMSAAADNKEARKVYRGRAKKIESKGFHGRFSQKGRGDRVITGTNVLTEIPNKEAKKTILIGAHLDKVNVGIGALDNASGTAAVFALLKAFKASPLKNYRLQAAFWDAEENGLVGSRVYVNDRKDKEGRLPDIYINFDIYGKGDSLWLWAANQDTGFIKGFKEVAEKAGFDHLIGPEYPGSDHRSFPPGGVEAFRLAFCQKAQRQISLNCYPEKNGRKRIFQTGCVPFTHQTIQGKLLTRLQLQDRYPLSKRPSEVWTSNFRRETICQS